MDASKKDLKEMDLQKITIAYLKMAIPGIYELALKDEALTQIVFGQAYFIVDTHLEEIIGTMIVHSEMTKDGLETRKPKEEKLRAINTANAVVAEVLDLKKPLIEKKEYAVCSI